MYAYVQIIILAKLNCLVDVEWSRPVGEGILSCCCCWLHADIHHRVIHTHLHLLGTYCPGMFIIHLLGAYCPGTLYRSPVGGLLPWDALTIQIGGGLCPGMLSIQRA